MDKKELDDNDDDGLINEIWLILLILQLTEKDRLDNNKNHEGARMPTTVLLTTSATTAKTRKRIAAAEVASLLQPHCDIVKGAYNHITDSSVLLLIAQLKI